MIYLYWVVFAHGEDSTQIVFLCLRSSLGFDQVVLYCILVMTRDIASYIAVLFDVGLW